MMIIRIWEDWRPTMVRHIFKRIAYMTRYGRIGFDEAMGMGAWYRNKYMEGVEALLEEEKWSLEDID